MALAPPFAHLCGQALAKRMLAGSVDRDRLSHAYLFSGPDGCGKSVAAEALAGLVLAAPAAGHPDFHVFAPERHRFLRDQALEVRRLAALKPYAGSHGVFVLKHAEALTGEAASVLLKLLEEPPGPALFLLLCEHADQVAATLRSRCQTVPFGPVPPNDLIPWLRERGVAEPERVAALSAGNPGRALAVADDPARVQQWERAGELLAEIGGGDLEDEMQRAAVAAADPGLMAVLGARMGTQLTTAGAMAHEPVPQQSLEGLAAWFDAEAALELNVTPRLTWEVLLLRLRRIRGLRYDRIERSDTATDSIGSNLSGGES